MVFYFKIYAHNLLKLFLFLVAGAYLMEFRNTNVCGYNIQ